jgi:hypothetical protein
LFEAIVWGIGFASCLYSEILFDQSILALYAPFPFLVWAALRLGTIGASSGLFLTTVFLILGISRHKGPFFYLIAHDMHFLQLFLAVLALPIMFVTILFEERQQVEARLLKSQEELNQNYKRIRDLTGRLIHSQEEERSRIARELHGVPGGGKSVTGGPQALLRRTPGSSRVRTRIATAGARREGALHAPQQIDTAAALRMVPGERAGQVRVPCDRRSLEHQEGRSR